MMDETLKILMNGWIDGAIRSYVFTMGPKSIKSYLRSLSEVLYFHLLNAVPVEKKERLDTTDTETIIDALGDIEVHLDITDVNSVSSKTDNDKLNLEMHNCPYADICPGILDELAESGMSIDHMPCLRTDLFIAALSIAGHKCRYKLVEVKPDSVCSSEIDFF
jgi:hypothetical protein